MSSPNSSRLMRMIFSTSLLSTVSMPGFRNSFSMMSLYPLCRAIACQKHPARLSSLSYVFTRSNPASVAITSLSTFFKKPRRIPYLISFFYCCLAFIIAIDDVLPGNRCRSYIVEISTIRFGSPRIGSLASVIKGIPRLTRHEHFVGRQSRHQPSDLGEHSHLVPRYAQRIRVR